MDAQVSDIETRLAAPDDWTVWRDLRLRALLSDPDAFGSTHEREAGFAEADWRARLDDCSGPAVLAFEQGAPVGMGGGWLHSPGHLMVVAMWTDPVSRGRGVGHAVLDHVVGWADERNLRVELWVADANPAARRLYERYGFRPDGSREPLRDGATEMKSRLIL